MLKKRTGSMMGAVLAVTLMMSGCAGGENTETTKAPAVAETTAETNQETKAEIKEETKEETKAEEMNQAQSGSGQGEKEYLKVYFDVELPEGNLESKNFSDALKKVAGEDAPVAEDMGGLSVLKAVMGAAGFDELVLSYPEDKTEERLGHYGIKAEGTAADKAYLACALDTGMIQKEQAAALAENKPVETGLAEQLLYKTADVNGDGRNYLGMSDDPSIYGKVDQAWNSFILFDDGTLSDIGKKAVEQGISTGYGLKSQAYAARFLPDLTLQYGHSDILHVHQLLGLLNSENLVAKVQLEPKISIYQYLTEWGPAPETTPVYEVKQFGDLYLVYAVEYDLQLEFASEEDLLKFDEVIKAYAKKNEGNEEAKGLIAGSWWQPLYSSIRTDLPSEDYHQIFDCVITNGIYSIHPFALPENKEKVISSLQALSGDLKVEAVERYCNTAFYNYMTGEDYQ